MSRYWNGSETADTLTSRNAGGGQRMPDKQNFNCVEDTTMETRSVVRRLTPLECERLQGVPDNYTNLGEWTDTNGKKHKDADSPRYKALGNGIATPMWVWMWKRMSAQFTDHRPTVGSLFDGIGTFPLIHEAVNGKGTARWGSEIEEFPIAVCRTRLGDEDAGIEGDGYEMALEKFRKEGWL